MRSGFTTISTFNRNFRRILGVSPQQWRSAPEHYERKLLNFDIKTQEGW
jgi:AraC-like DNA-binding protein